MKLNINNPIVTVVIPNYNHKPFLQQRLDSVFNQTFEDFEVILLDDCSTDKSIEILKKYSNHPKVTHLVLNKNNAGSPFKQWQKGIELAKGSYIWIAESDDFCTNDFLSQIMRKFNAEDNLGIVYTQSIDVDEQEKKKLDRITYTANFNPNIWVNNFSISGNKFVQNYLQCKNVIPNASAVVFKKTLVKDIFSKELLKMKMCGDWLFWIKIALKTDIGFISERLNFFRNHSLVTRNHNSLIKIKTRLLEESLIRSYLQEIDNNDIKFEKELYRKWSRLFKFKSFFSNDFKKIKLNHSSYFFLLGIAISEKVRRLIYKMRVKW